MLTDDDWNHLIATCNVLELLNQACGLLSGQRYHTLALSYNVSCGIHGALSKPSSSVHASIENVVKKNLLCGFQNHFDDKLSAEQKNALLIAAYLDPHSFLRMTVDCRKIAEDLILNKINYDIAAGPNRDTSIINTIQKQVNDPLDIFLANCGMSQDVPSITMHPLQQRSAMEELSFYVDRLKVNQLFKEFWNTYNEDLPRMAALVRAYNMRPASSVPSEALFSVAEYVHRKHRSSLGSDTLRYSMVLRDSNIVASLV
ncbi:unnamed protein product [Adineta steineri]|uniref:HAT C-terminal dimerisation domain-containing protein n=1 Tax=Adineta steineri TaxID=433720 RepID=A0A815KPG3_9BILA|nr:unnamed protein product [Adineta steineri]CAF4071661.1 unnamed protein product [Adineta steineri]